MNTMKDFIIIGTFKKCFEHVWESLWNVWFPQSFKRNWELLVCSILCCPCHGEDIDLLFKLHFGFCWIVIHFFNAIDYFTAGVGKPFKSESGITHSSHFTALGKCCQWCFQKVLLIHWQDNKPMSLFFPWPTYPCSGSQCAGHGVCIYNIRFPKQSLLSSEPRVEILGEQNKNGGANTHMKCAISH